MSENGPDRPVEHVVERFHALCPVCGSEWQSSSPTEQAASIDLFGECIPCKFSPVGAGTGDGTKDDLHAMLQRKDEMLSMAGKTANAALSGCGTEETKQGADSNRSPL